MIRKYAWISVLLLLAVLLAMTGGNTLAEEEENLIRNGSFSELDANGLPVGWQKGMWLSESGISRLYVDPDGYDGNSVVVINADENDARFTQTIDVEPDTLYRFSCMVFAKDCGLEGYGANLSFENTFSYSEIVRDTLGEWRKLTVYGRTGKEQNQVTVMLRMGGYSQTSTGWASFDDVECVRVSELPSAVGAVSLAEFTASAQSETEKAENNDEMPERNTETYLFLIALYAILALAAARRHGRVKRLDKRTAAVLLSAGLCAAFLIRVILAVRVRGYNTDINCFSAWAERIYARGLNDFYADDYFCDYPPGYMILLWIPACLKNLLGCSWQDSVHLLLIKMIPILSDLLAAMVIYRFAVRKNVETGSAAVLALFYMLNPAVFIDSAAWGQMDGVVTLFLVLSAVFASDEKYIPALISYAGALLMKTWALVFGPIGLIFILVRAFGSKDRKKILSVLLGTVAALALLYFVSFIVTYGSPDYSGIFYPVQWMVKLYSESAGGYDYITVNSLNLYTLLGKNWVTITRVPGLAVFAWSMLGVSFLFSCWMLLRSRREYSIFLVSGTFMLLVFAFAPMMHERYVFPAIIILTIAYAATRDKRVLASAVIVTCTTAMNEILVLQGGMGTGNYGHLQSSEQWLNVILSGINVLNALFTAYTCLDICLFRNCLVLSGSPDDIENPVRIPDYRLKLKRKDYLVIGLITAAYGVLAFTNLGTTKAPQTTWTASRGGENVVIDLGEVRTSRMIYYGNICNTNFTVEMSNDGVRWTEPVYAKYDQGEIFRWLYFIPSQQDGSTIYAMSIDPQDGSSYINYASNSNKYPMQTARYYRLTAVKASLALMEIGFWDEEGNLLEIANIYGSDGLDEFSMDPCLLVDEQDTVACEPSYLNSTYFDEIYHARTAYELLHGLSVYEWTHPPLGKVLMMVGVWLFGMCPFGWRFMGTLVGVLMLPMMYLLVKQLTKSSRLAIIGMVLMALDSMHFTQTRIATIDSYPVFFIMLEYFFMFRYIQMDWRKTGLGRTFIPLGLCGITMGVACATKWIGIYAGIGLAILFFANLIVRTSRAVRENREMSAKIGRQVIGTLLFCVLFFVIIPVLIYYFSYFRQLRYEGVASLRDMLNPRWIKRVWDLQQSMLSYHEGLGSDTHYFRSPWYQWPIIYWPMWYYSGTAYMPEGIISSISCMGNPAVWWSGLVCMITVTLVSAWKRRADKTALVVLIGFASQYMPWILVPRSTFIYHYFASVPFIILCVCLVLEMLREKDEKTFRWTAVGLVSAAAVLFAAFYPLESGTPVARSYAQYLRWFKWYNY